MHLTMVDLDGFEGSRTNSLSLFDDNKTNDDLTKREHIDIEEFDRKEKEYALPVTAPPFPRAYSKR